MRRCLNIGCGTKPIASTAEEEWINLDIRPLPGVDVVRDIRYGLPFADAVFDELLCDNNLEHLASPDAIRLINEMGRILIVGGIVRIIVPHGESACQWQDPTHVSAWVPRSFQYWSQTGTPYGGLAVGITANLVVIAGPMVSGDMDTEAFIHVTLRKEPL